MYLGRLGTVTTQAGVRQKYLSYAISDRWLYFAATMQFRAHTSSDERRRRLLTEGVAADGANPRRRAASCADAMASDTGEVETGQQVAAVSQRYTQAALMENQPRITDFIPQRPWVLLLLLVVNLAVIGGLIWLYSLMPRWAAHTTDGRIAAFDLDSEGSLGAWYSSTVLALAATYAMLVYHLRRHRIDDYRGRYRTWFLAALCFAMMSVDESASLHEGFKEMMTLLTGHRLYGDGSVWWIMAYGVVLGWIGIRLLLDLRECWSSLLTMLAAALCYSAAIAVQLEFVLEARGAVGVMVEEGLEMLGNVLLWLGCALHARYIVRDIQGLIPPRKQRKKGEASGEEATKPRRRRRAAAAETEGDDEATAKPKRAAKAAAPSKAPATTAAAATATRTKSAEANSAGSKTVTTSTGDKIRVDQPEEAQNNRLSKAERRALRKERRKQR